jgi:hypothetical protein
MSAYKISLSGLQPTINKIRSTGNDIRNQVDAKIGEGVVEMSRMAVRLAPKDKSFLASKISGFKKADLNWMLAAQSEYAAFMEFGTKGFVDIPSGLQQYAAQFRGKGRTGNRKLKDVIYEWCRRKGIPKERWWFIYRQIRDNGVKPHPFFFPSVFAFRPQIVKNVIKLLREKRK